MKRYIIALQFKEEEMRMMKNQVEAAKQMLADNKFTI